MDFLCVWRTTRWNTLLRKKYSVGVFYNSKFYFYFILREQCIPVSVPVSQRQSGLMLRITKFNELLVMLRITKNTHKSGTLETEK